MQEAVKAVAMNYLVIGLCLSSGCSNLASARSFFDAHPKAALELLVFPDCHTL